MFAAVGCARPVHSNTGLGAVVFRTNPTYFFLSCRLFRLPMSRYAWFGLPAFLSNASDPTTFPIVRRTLTELLNRSSSELCRIVFYKTIPGLCPKIPTSFLIVFLEERIIVSSAYRLIVDGYLCFFYGIDKLLLSN
jgi:hypothetical protein